MQIREVSNYSFLVDARRSLTWSAIPWEQLHIIAEVQFQLPGREEGEQGHGSHLEGSERAPWTGPRTGRFVGGAGLGSGVDDHAKTWWLADDWKHLPTTCWLPIQWRMYICGTNAVVVLVFPVASSFALVSCGFKGDRKQPAVLSKVQSKNLFQPMVPTGQKAN